MARTNAQRQAALAENTNAPTEQVNETVNEHANTGTVDDTAPKAEAKSIVPKKYSGKYKNGGSDELATFIKSVCGEGDKFEFSAFFALCRANIGGSLTEDKIAHYEAQVAADTHGAKGRARMTLRNMLAPIARKEGGLKNLAGEKIEFTLPKPTVSGAAAAVQSGESSSSTESSAGGTDAGSEQTAETADATE